MIPAFSGISTSLFYLRVFNPSLEIASKQIKEINLLKKNDLESKDFKEKYDNNKIHTEKNYLVLDKISFYYDKKHLFENFNLNIPKNSFISIIGRSGSGKSTLQNIMMGLLKPKSGNIFLKTRI